ncbi:TIGR04066 family peptide maturation system protein [Clostridioides difficile]|uniref:TIGR04066 family peptide maturation system protein n=1 Tax=Clostridioides difficile TaxID=1496 RepID=UPI000BB1B75E|nr:TIGR04066 family peptide maturation system protein [Clostridioides difficile]PBE51794.1 hypothetical protein BGU21_06790 [Clostridioides difficile]HBF8929246.1 TIGR04066 family peptide maturation system protein [Clostridioides difficile]
MEKVLIYPFNYNFFTILNHCNKISDIEINSLVSPSGWGLCNKEYNVNNIITKVTNDFQSELKKNSLVWFVDSKENLDLEKFIIPKLKVALKEGKKILYTRDDLNKISRYISHYEFKKINEWNLEKYEIRDIEGISQINTPIIFICGLYGGLDTFDVNIRIGEELRKRGFSILQFGPKKESYLFKMIPIPEFMFDDSISSKTKIINFNHFIKDKEVEAKPDLIIIEVPGELFPFSRKMVGNFGIRAFEISNAVINDCGILCIPSSIYDREYCEELKYFIKGRHSINIDYFSIEKKVIDTYETEVKQKFSYMSLDENFFVEDIEDYEKTFFIHDNKQLLELVDNIVNQLKEYAKVISI